LGSYGWLYIYPAAAGFLSLVVLTIGLCGGGLRPIEHALRRIAVFMVRRGLFRVPVARDVIRIDLLRIATGVVLLLRTQGIASFVFDGPDPLHVKITCAVTLAVAAAFTLGIATPLASLVLLFMNVMVFDTFMRTYTLGSDVLAMTMLVFAFLPAGTSLSIDSLIVRRDWPGAAMIRTLYAIVGPPTFLRAVITKTACLIAYSLLCLYSASLHVHEAFWLSGNVGYMVLSSSYFNSYYPLFRDLFSSYYGAILAARAAMIGMLFWYLTFGAFVLIGGVFRWFAILWALSFFIVSAFILQLGVLGYYEFIFLALLFWSRAFLNVHGRSTLLVLYDDRCNLCDRTVRMLRFLDIFRVVALRPLSRNSALLAQLGVRSDAALTDLYGHDSHAQRTYSGYDFYLEISKRLLLLVPAFPLLVLGRLLQIGPALYRIVASYRTRWFGVCRRGPQFSAAPIGGNPLLQGRARRLPRAMFAAFATIYGALAAFFIATLPPLQTAPPPPFLSQLAHVYGLTPINVFNKADMKMNEHWFVIHATHADGTSTLLPFTGNDGQRLAWHGSDRVYFGNSLLWRRNANLRATICFDPADRGELREIFGWYALRSTKPATGYTVRYYQQPPPHISLTGPPYFVLDEARTTCTARFDAKGTLLGVDKAAADASR
jgi:predicted DCC family thiol-disulfide oxidoreductase YuxK